MDSIPVTESLRARPPVTRDYDHVSPLKKFISGSIVPQYAEPNVYPQTFSHRHLLWRAAKRAKITPKKIGATSIALYHSGAAIAGIEGNTTSLVSHQAKRITRSPSMTRRHLQASEVPTLVGRAFHVSQQRTAASFIRELGQPVVARPPLTQTGQSAALDVRDEHELTDAWDVMADACKHLPVVEQQIDLEAYRSGLVIRVFVAGEEVHAAVVRVPLYVVGDGNSTVGELADAEIGRRKEHNYLADRGPEITDEFLHDAATSRREVLPDNEVKLLTKRPDVDNGWGLSIDVLDRLNSSLKTLAVDAMWAIPGLPVAGIEVLAPSLDSPEGAAVLGIQPDADLAEFRFPAYGQGRNAHHSVMAQILSRQPK